MKKILYKVPANFTDENYLSKLADCNNKYADYDTKIAETYGSVSSSYIGNARTSSHLPDVTLADIEKYLNESNSVGIDFNYTINSSWSNGLEFTQEGKDKIIEELFQLEKIGIKKVTVCSPGILHIIKKRFSSFDICLSTNLYISSLHELQRWETEGIKTVVLNRHINRDFDLLKSMNNSKIQLEILINSMCNLYCSLKFYHNLVNCAQSNVTSERWTTYFPQSLCTKYNLKNPIETLCCSWVRPEDMDFYCDRFGINLFKIDGRSLESEHLLSIIESYMAKFHDGNFYDLFDFFNTRRKTQVNLYLDNRELDGFIEQICKSNISCRLCGGHNELCKSLSSKIMILNKNNAKVYEKMLENNIKKEF